MPTFTRRGLIKQSSIGAATAGALLAVPGLASGPAGAAASASVTLPTEPMAAYVRNAASGEISLLIGRREIVIHDPELVQRLAKATM
jgi:hypothetical protein